VNYGVKCVIEFNMDVWCMLPSWWIMESPICDHEWLVGLILQIKEFMEAF